MFKKLSLIVLLAISAVAYAQIPTYYNDVNLNLTGTSLRDELATKVINTHTTTLSYGWTVIQQTDLDPSNSANVLLIYGSNDADGNYITDRTRSVNSNGGTNGTDWNREHTYPKSLGNPNLGTSGPGADVHHLRASDVTLNNQRGSLKFASGSGVAGSSGSGWYPGDEWKGDVARMMMYMYIRYGSRCYPSGVAIGTTNSVDSNMIDLLLEWNAADPVSQYETNRNTILEGAQGNRNPFIDNPAFATTIWGGTQAEDKFSGASAEKEINLQGNGVTITDGSVVTTTTNNTDFGSVDSASGTIIKTFTIQNTGGETLTLSGNPSISTGNAADFSITTNPATLTLAAGASTTFQVTFDPSADGVRTTLITVLSDDADEATYTFTISGTGTSSGGGSGGGSSCGTELFISEYIEGSSNNKYLELYNPTSSSIDLSSYSLVIYYNGNSSIGSTLSLSGNLAAETTYVIANGSASLYASPDVTHTGVTSFNGDDAVALRKSGIIIDVIGQIGVDPGSKWPGTCSTVNATLIRNPTITAGDTDGSDAFTTNTEWSCTSQDDVSNLGSHTISCSSSGSQEIDLEGNSTSIPNGSTSTTTTNNTDFGSADTASETITKTFTIKNLGGSVLTLSGNPTISSGDTADFSITSNPSLTVAASGSTTFEVTFNPTSDGVKTTTVTIASDDADEGSYTFNVSGTGTTNSSALCGTELFISEYIEGSGENKFLEIYNPTGSSINLSDYDIVTYVNGSATVSQTQALSGSIASESTFVIENSAENLSVTADLSVTAGVMAFSGDDVVALRKSGTIIDVIGQIGVDPGSTWLGTCGTQGNTLIRISSVGAGDIDGTDAFTTDTEWTCTTTDDVSNLGSHSISCVTGPEISIQGNSNNIIDGSTITSSSNNTFLGSVSVSSGSIMKSFTILNTGTSTLTLSGNPAISGANSADFSITSNPTLTIASGTSTTFEITFDPSAVGARDAIITVLSDDVDEATFTFNIQGIGLSGAIPCASASGATLFSQDFETVPALPTLTYTVSTGLTESTGTGSFPTGDNMFSGGSKGLQVNDDTSSIDFATFDSTSYSNLEFSIRLASFAGTAGNGADAADYVKVLISTDNGGTYSEELTINGASSANSFWSFSSGTGEATTTYDGDNTTTTFAPSGSGARTTDGYSTLKVSSLPLTTTLKIRLEIKNNSGNEYWVIDDAKITGDSESLATWDGSWSGTALSSSVKVVFDGDYDMTSEASINACECEVNSGSTLTISADKYLKIENNIINNGTIIIEDSGNLVQVADDSTISGSGSYFVKRNTTNLTSSAIYTYWSSPLTSSTLADVASDAGLYYSFNPSNQSWQRGSASTSMTPGVGYIVQGPASISYPGSYTAEFSGSEFNNGTISVSSSVGESTTSGADDNWNLIGNPYPSAIDANLFLSENEDLNGTIYFWTHNTAKNSSAYYTQDDYVSWNGTGSTSSCSGCAAPTSFIASGQGFFVQAITSSSIDFNNSIRVSSGNDNFYKNETKAIEDDKIWLNLSSNKSFNQILIGFLERATDGIDRLYDGEKLDGGTSANFYSLIDGRQFVIQGKSPLKEIEEIPLGFSSSVLGDFTISIDKFNGNIENSEMYLQDNLLNIQHSLKESDYNFSITETGTFNDRFVLVIGRSAKVLSVINDKISGEVSIENFKNNLVIKTSNNSLIKKVSVYNLLGKELITKNVSSENVQLTSKLLKRNAVLIVKTLLEDDTIIVHKIVKN